MIKRIKKWFKAQRDSVKEAFGALRIVRSAIDVNQVVEREIRLISPVDGHEFIVQVSDVIMASKGYPHTIPALLVLTPPNQIGILTHYLLCNNEFLKMPEMFQLGMLEHEAGHVIQRHFDIGAVRSNIKMFTRAIITPRSEYMADAYAVSRMGAAVVIAALEYFEKKYEEYGFYPLEFRRRIKRIRRNHKVETIHL